MAYAAPEVTVCADTNCLRLVMKPEPQPACSFSLLGFDIVFACADASGQALQSLLRHLLGEAPHLNFGSIHFHPLLIADQPSYVAALVPVAMI